MTQCILCHSQSTAILQTIKQDDINALYERAFGLDVSHIITSNLLYHHCKICDLRFFTCEDGTIPTGDNHFYNTLNTLEWYYFAKKHEYDYVQKYINPESKVLEVSCGKAAFAHFLPPEAKKHYIGLELSTGAKEMASKDGICIENISVEEYAKSHAKGFDIACSFQVLEHVSNPYGFLQAQIECLKDSQLNGGGGI